MKLNKTKKALLLSFLPFLSLQAATAAVAATATATATVTNATPPAVTTAFASNEAENLVSPSSSLSLSLSSAPQTFTINQIIVFGDSLSDDGNLYRVLGQMAPAGPYYLGHFSSGPVWTEALSKIFNFQNETPHYFINTPSTLTFTPGSMINYAMGGAWAAGLSTDSPITDPLANTETLKNAVHMRVFPYDLMTQVHSYEHWYHETQLAIDARQIFHKETLPKPSLEHTLFVIWIGGNDYLNLGLDGQMHGRPDVDYAVDEVLAAHEKAIHSLVDMGARHFIIGNLPDFRDLPESKLHPDKKDLFGALSDQHDEKLITSVQTWQQTWAAKGVTLQLIDLRSALKRIIGRKQAQTALHSQNSGIHLDYPCHLESPLSPPALSDNTASGLDLKTIFSSNPVVADALNQNPNLATTITLVPGTMHCDLYKPGDQLAYYTANDYYSAGGTFFDHVHPLMQDHEMVADFVLSELQNPTVQGKPMPITYSMYTQNGSYLPAQAFNALSSGY